jgi:hypothetical protein
MRHSRTCSYLTKVVIATAMMLITLTTAEAVPSHASGLKGGPATPWAADIWRVAEALAKKDVNAAELAWHEAYVAALRSQRWEGLIEVGTVALRIGEVAGDRKGYEATARGVYWTAFFLTHQQGSVDGLLRTAEAFAALGDREVAAQCIRMAESLLRRCATLWPTAACKRSGSVLAAQGGRVKSPHVSPF